MSEAVRNPAVLRTRPMQSGDLDAVIAMEQAAYPRPWTRGIFADCLEVGYQCRVHELEGELVGYSVHSVAAGEAHLLNLCVDPKFQGQGLGRAILRQVLSETKEQGADTLFLEVRASNSRAQALYESEGFNEVGRRFNYYPADGGREDALIYARPLL